ncbi:MAG TPA: transposase [Candidatus Anaerobiospirillum stercoravium]|nr:transposase [Candidatus Anaerobiospirillum stercoravium]
MSHHPKAHKFTPSSVALALKDLQSQAFCRAQAQLIAEINAFSQAQDLPTEVVVQAFTQLDTQLVPLPVAPTADVLVDFQVQPTQEEALELLQLFVDGKPLDAEGRKELACAGIRYRRELLVKVLKDTLAKYSDRFKRCKKLKSTLLQFIQASLLAFGESREGHGLLVELVRHYQRLCFNAGLAPCCKSVIEKFIAANSKASCHNDPHPKAKAKKVKDKARARAKARAKAQANVRGQKKDMRPYFKCLLTDLAYELFNALRMLTLKGILGDGYLVVASVQAKLHSIRRVIAIDGSINRMGDNASERSLRDGAEPDSCKGLTGTCSREVHVGLDLASCSLLGGFVTSGVFSERRAVLKMIDDGVITKGDLVIMDAGYISGPLFAKLNAAGIYYIVKGRKSNNPKVLSYVLYETNRTELPDELELPYNKLSDWLTMKALTQGQPMGTQKLKDLPCGWRGCLDTIVDMKFAGPVRMIKLYNECKDRKGNDLDPYVYLYTNLPSDCFSPTAIWALSRCRWQVEFGFRNLKSFCFMCDWETDLIGRADFYILMAMVSYLVKIWVAQPVQIAMEHSLSPYKVCNTHESTLACILGLDHFWFLNVSFAEPFANVSNRSVVTKSKLQAWSRRQQLYGPAAWLFFEWDNSDLGYVTPASSTKREKLKSLSLVAVMMHISPLPDVKLRYPEAQEHAQAQSEGPESAQVLPEAAESSQARSEGPESVPVLPKATESTQVRSEGPESVPVLPTATKRLTADMCAQVQPLIQASQDLLESMAAMGGWNSIFVRLKSKIALMQADPGNYWTFVALKSEYLALVKFTDI